MLQSEMEAPLRQAGVVFEMPKKQLLGQLLLESGLILPQDLEFALEHQKHGFGLLGEILVRIGALNRKDLELALGYQRR